MTSAPGYYDWKALRVAVVALIAAGLTGQPKAFLKAVREAKAAAVVLLFALARSLWTDDDSASEPVERRRCSRLSGFREVSEDTWRNPPAIPCRLEGRRAATPPPRRGPTAPDPERLDQRVAQAFQTLQRILSLCDDYDVHAARLQRRLARNDVGLATAEAKAFGVNARAQARRNREARRFIDQTWRGRRRRRESG